jgi:hypothetical protein
MLQLLPRFRGVGDDDGEVVLRVALNRRDEAVNPNGDVVNRRN